MAAAIDPNEHPEEAAIIFLRSHKTPDGITAIQEGFFYLLNLVVPGFERYQS